MSVGKPHPGSPYWCDFTLPEPFRRVQVNTHQRTKPDARAVEAVLRELYRSGQYQTLRAVIAGELRAPDVLAAKRERRLDSDALYADLKLRAPLWATLQRLFGDARRGTQRHRYLTSAAKLERLELEGLGTTARVVDLGAVDWEAVLDAWPDSEADFNHARRMVSRALSLLLGDSMHPARRAIVKAIPRAREARSRKAELSVARFLEILAHVPAEAEPKGARAGRTYTRRANLRAAYLTMFITGMRTGEYLRCGHAHLRPDLHMVDVPGRKTDGAAALVAVDPSLWHWIEDGVPSPLAYKWLRLQWKRAAKAAGYPGIRLHDIRHLTATAGLLGGATLAEVQALMRHADPAMTMDYAATSQSRAAARGVAKVLPMRVRQRSA